ELARAVVVDVRVRVHPGEAGDGLDVVPALDRVAVRTLGVEGHRLRVRVRRRRGDVAELLPVELAAQVEGVDHGRDEGAAGEAVGIVPRRVPRTERRRTTDVELVAHRHDFDPAADALVIVVRVRGLVREAHARTAVGHREVPGPAHVVAGLHHSVKANAV